MSYCQWIKTQDDLNVSVLRAGMISFSVSDGESRCVFTGSRIAAHTNIRLHDRGSFLWTLRGYKNVQRTNTFTERQACIKEPPDPSSACQRASGEKRGESLIAFLDNVLWKYGSTYNSIHNVTSKYWRAATVHRNTFSFLLLHNVLYQVTLYVGL